MWRLSVPSYLEYQQTPPGEQLEKLAQIVVKLAAEFKISPDQLDSNLH
jgi:hypothetical protein